MQRLLQSGKALLPFHNGLVSTSEVQKVAQNRAVSFTKENRKILVDAIQNQYQEIYTHIAQAFAKHPAFKLHYALCVNEETLQEVFKIDSSQNQRLFIAASVEGLRLIDNIALK